MLGGAAAEDQRQAKHRRELCPAASEPATSARTMQSSSRSTSFICAMVCPGGGSSPAARASMRASHIAARIACRAIEDVGEREAQGDAVACLIGRLLLDAAQYGRGLVLLGLLIVCQVVDDLAQQAHAQGAPQHLPILVTDELGSRRQPAPLDLLVVGTKDVGQVAHDAHRRAMSAAVAPAPTPLSTLTTTSPGVQLWSMPSRAASPRPPRP